MSISSFWGALRGRSVLSSADLSVDETAMALQAAMELKAERNLAPAPLHGQCLALIFEKPSLRTRVTFETAFVQLGGHPIYLAPGDIGLGTRETVPDVARNLSRWVQGIVARTFAHHTVEELAQFGTIPVINALSDREHPCQALADFQTILERAGSVRDFPIAWIGDGNNVCHSFLLTGARLGAEIRVASPPGYTPDRAIVREAKADAAKNGGSITIMPDAFDAVRGAGAVYTDVWTSMGQETERDERLMLFQGYQVNAELMREARPDAFVLHCLPAHRGEEITAEVLDGPQSAVLDQAENRLHAQKALLAMLMG
ncbi:MAG TPA: ornithine carbamoyltransferase [Armatimonadota bacterium]|nr:ornithine carbamoyltransferase [Armatimonadota bacterium]